MAKISQEAEHVYARMTGLLGRGKELKQDFSFSGFFNLAQDVVQVVEEEYTTVRGFMKKKIAIEVVLDLYDKNKWEFAPGIPSFIEKKLIKFVLNRGIDYIVDILKKYVWDK